MIKYDVQCPHCCGTFFETNGLFKTDAPANGSMFAAKQHVVDAAWSHFPLYDSTEYDDITCPSCDGIMVDALGRVLRLDPIGEVDEVSDKVDLNALMDELLTDYVPNIPDKPVESDADKVATDIMPSVQINEDPSRVVCPVCGKECAAKGLRVHIAAKHPEYKG